MYVKILNIFRHNIEPNVNLSLRSQGVESSIISLQPSRISPEPFEAIPEPVLNLPERYQALRVSQEFVHTTSESILANPEHSQAELNQSSRISPEPFQTSSDGRRASTVLEPVTEEGLKF